MDFDDLPGDAAFRAELRGFLAANDPGEAPDEDFEFRRAWQRLLAEGGWAAPGWPAEWGGRDATVSQMVVYEEELAAARAPVIINSIGVWNIGPTLLGFGTPEQKQRWLPPMLRAEEIWCQGFSEPGAGSDLSAIATRAVRDGGDFVVDGQKVWISRADRSDRCLLLCRTEAGSQRHRGLSVFVVDMRADGVECRALRDITGGSGFNEVFFSGVRVPATDLVGDEGQGWAIATTALTHERIGTVTYGIQLRQKLDDLIARAETWPPDEVRGRVLAQAVAGLWIDVELIRLTALRAVTKVQRGADPWPEVPIGKLLWSTVSQALAETSVRALGPDGARWTDAARDLVWSRMTTIGAGTTEIQKNVLAERALGLPRG